MRKRIYINNFHFNSKENVRFSTKIKAKKECDIESEK